MFVGNAQDGLFERILAGNKGGSRGLDLYNNWCSFKEGSNKLEKYGIDYGYEIEDEENNTIDSDASFATVSFTRPLKLA